MELSDSQFYSGLGSLSRLPLDVRLEIWDYFSLDIGRGPYEEYLHDPPIRPLDFLRASKSIYCEASDFVYRKIIVSFECGIRPHTDPLLSIYPNRQMQNIAITFESALAKSLSRAPLSKFRAIHVTISLPSHTRGQTCLGIVWLQSVQITELLARAEHRSAHISIYVRVNAFDICQEEETAETRTSELTVATPFLPSYDFDHWASRSPGTPESDACVVLMPFRCLRHFKSSYVLIVGDLKGARALEAHLETLLIRDVPFGAHCDPENDTLSDPNIFQANQELKNYMCIASPYFFSSRCSHPNGETEFHKEFQRSLQREDRFVITSRYHEAQRSLIDKQTAKSGTSEYKGQAGPENQLKEIQK